MIASSVIQTKEIIKPLQLFGLISNVLCLKMEGLYQDFYYNYYQYVVK